MGCKCCSRLCTLKYFRIPKLNTEECLGSDARKSVAQCFYQTLTSRNTSQFTDFAIWYTGTVHNIINFKACRAELKCYLFSFISFSFSLSALGGSSALHIPAFPGGGCLIDYVPQVCQLLTNKVKNNPYFLCVRSFI